MVERASTSLACIVGHDLQAPSKVGLALSSLYSVLRASSLAKVEAFFSLSNLISFNHALHSEHSTSSEMVGVSFKESFSSFNSSNLDSNSSTFSQAFSS
jgi:hypothetical protein